MTLMTRFAVRRARRLMTRLAAVTAVALAVAIGVGVGLGMGTGTGTEARAQAPGPESFATPPRTPAELWEAVDYLVRSGQAAKATPYLDAFLASNPSDEVLLQLRDQYGIGPVLRLQNDPATQAQAVPVMERFNAASRKLARDPKRLEGLVKSLTGTADEQTVAIEQLRSAGPFAVPAIVSAMSGEEVPAAARESMARALGRLDRTAVPPLEATLESPDAKVASAAAAALGRIGDPKAIPALVYPAASPGASSALRVASQTALASLTGRPFAALSPSPVRILTDAARRRLARPPLANPSGRGGLGEPEEVDLWTWSEGAPASRSVPRAEADVYQGIKMARQALEIDPSDRQAQALLVAFDLARVDPNTGPDPASDPTGATARALAAGPSVLADAFQLGLDTGRGDLAARAVRLLGRGAGREGTLEPLVRALSAPDRRTRFAAAEAIIDATPGRAFPGSNRVVPVLSTFLRTQEKPRVVVIDGDVNRGNLVASVVRELGYDPIVAPDGPQAFRLAAEGADVEAIFLEPTVLQGPWRGRDLMANLRADARTAGLPVFVHGPLRRQGTLENGMMASDARTSFVVTPVDASTFKTVLERELGRMGIRALDAAEKEALAARATELLAEAATRPNSPFAADIPAAEPALSAALRQASTASSASKALGDIPDVNAQRSLADALLDPSRSAEQRLQAASDLARSLQRFGPLISAGQEQRLASLVDDPAQQALHAAASEVIGALRPRPEAVGARLRRVDPTSVLKQP
jgi:HEAT repeat protein